MLFICYTILKWNEKNKQDMISNAKRFKILFITVTMMMMMIIQGNPSVYYSPGMKFSEGRPYCFWPFFSMSMPESPWPYEIRLLFQTDIMPINSQQEFPSEILPISSCKATTNSLPEFSSEILPISPHKATTNSLQEFSPEILKFHSPTVPTTHQITNLPRQSQKSDKTLQNLMPVHNDTMPVHGD